MEAITTCGAYLRGIESRGAVGPRRRGPGAEPTYEGLKGFRSATIGKYATVRSLPTRD